MSDSEGMGLDIQKYCALNEETEYNFLKAPFRVGDLVCAGDRHFMIHLEVASEDFKTNTPEVPIKWRKVMETIIDRGEGVELVDIPNWTKPSTEACDVCNGEGVEHLSVCPDCDGSFKFDHWCRTCDEQRLVADENGSKYRCDNCCGSGEVTITKKDRFVDLLPNCAPIDFQYIEMISELPSVKVGVLPRRKGVAFSFEGGFGGVMGARV